MRGFFSSFFASGVLILAALPSSTSYTLHNYSIGSGGTSGSSSATYKLNGTAGEQSSVQSTGTSFAVKPGDNNIQNANVPTATITNPASYYNKLLVTIGTQGNPTDTLYAIAISTDGFSSTTNYVKSDNTIGSSLVYPTDYRTYASWGSGSGTLVIGLTPNVTYTVKAKAIQGKFSESPYGPTTSAVTSTAQLSFSLSPSTVSLGALLAGSVITASPNGSITFDTNAESGGNVYVASKNAGLKSTSLGSQINSATADLSSATSGYGAQGSSATQTSGGPFTIVSPFNAASNNVGGLTLAFQPIFNSVAPIVAGSSLLVIKAKASALTPAANDYSDILTLVAAGSF